MFEPVTVPGRGEEVTADALRSEIGAWARSVPLRALVERFGGRVDESELPALLRGLDEFSAGTWDFRANRERNLVDPDTVTGESEELVLAAAAALGLVHPNCRCTRATTTSSSWVVSSARVSGVRRTPPICFNIR